MHTTSYYVPCYLGEILFPATGPEDYFHHRKMGRQLPWKNMPGNTRPKHELTGYRNYTPITWLISFTHQTYHLSWTINRSSKFHSENPHEFPPSPSPPQPFPGPSPSPVFPASNAWYLRRHLLSPDLPSWHRSAPRPCSTPWALHGGTSPYLTSLMQKRVGKQQQLRMGPISYQCLILF